MRFFTLLEKKFKFKIFIKLTINILQSPSLFRSDLQLLVIKKYTENVKTFMEISEDKKEKIHDDCAKLMTYEYFEKGNYVFKYGL